MKVIENIRLLTIEETAEILGVNPATIRRHIKEGKLNGIKLGKTLIRVSDLCQTLGVEDIDTTRFEENNHE